MEGLFSRSEPIIYLNCDILFVLMLSDNPDTLHYRFQIKPQLHTIPKDWPNPTR
uniref:Uncharacterized protein n=1 Tax=Arundo donax TaxID=35708 RepID=A0A0A8ZS66_ARUDO